MPDRGRRFPVAALAAAWTVTLIGLLAVGVSASVVGVRLLVLNERAAVLDGIVDRMARADGELTLVARLGARTGDPEWAERYEETANALDKALAELIEIEPELGRSALRADYALETRKTLERQALEFAASGNVAGAEVILDGLIHEGATTRWEAQVDLLVTEARQRRAGVQAAGWRIVTVVIVISAIGLTSMFIAWWIALRGVRRWSDDLTRAEQTVQLAEAQQTLVIEAVDLGLFEMDPLDRSVLLSEAAARLFRVEPGRLDGDVALANVTDADLMLAAIDASGVDPSSSRVSLRVQVTTDGQVPHDLEILGRMLHDTRGVPSRFLGLVRDVTAQARVQRARAAWTASLETQVLQRTAEAEARARQARELAAELTVAERRVRQRVARILHDGLQQDLVAARLQLAGGRVEIVDDLIREAIANSRALAAELDPPVDPDEGLGEALDWLADRLERRHGLHVTLGGDGLSDALPDQRGSVLFQAAQELLFNVVKHAGVSAAEVHVTSGPFGVRLEVRDRGRGLGVDSPQPGLGLAHTARRLEALGGGLELRAEEPGCTAVAWLPPVVGDLRAQAGGQGPNEAAPDPA